MPHGSTGSFFTVRIALAAALTFAIATQTEAGAELRLFSFEEPHMGTLFTIRAYAEDEESALAGAKAAFTRIDALEAIFSDYDATSEVMRLVDAPHGTPVKVSAELFEATALARDLSGKSAGAFDITMGPHVRNWRLARRTGKLPSEEARAAAKAATGYEKIHLARESGTITLGVADMRLDYGGIAKGLAADAALAVLRQAGFPRSIVAASGDIAMGDPPPDQAEGWKIDIEHIKGNPQSFRLKNCGLSTSGDAVQFIEIKGHRYSHIVDPRTGLGLENRLTATVIAPRAAESDALATAACILGAEARKRPVFQDENVRLIVTPTP